MSLEVLKSISEPTRQDYYKVLTKRLRYPLEERFRRVTEDEFTEVERDQEVQGDEYNERPKYIHESECRSETPEEEYMSADQDLKLLLKEFWEERRDDELLGIEYEEAERYLRISWYEMKTTSKWISWKDECENMNINETIKFDVISICQAFHNRFEEIFFKNLPTCRFMTYCHSTTCFSAPTIAIVDEAEKLLEQLAQTRLLTSQPMRPIIFIAYSTSGIVLKQALFSAWINEKHRNIWDATVSVIFLGTPQHRTENTTLGNIIAGVPDLWEPCNRSRRRRRRSSSDSESSGVKKTQYDIAYALDANNESFMRLTSIFEVLIGCRVYSFYGTKPIGADSHVVSESRELREEVPNINDTSCLFVEKDATLFGIRNEVQIAMDTSITETLTRSSSKDDSYKKLCAAISDVLTSQITSNVQIQEVASLISIQAPQSSNNMSLVSTSPLQSHCPVCGTLLLSGLTKSPGTLVSIPEYSVDYGPLKGRLITLWYDRCGLARVVYYLARIWSRKAADVEWMRSTPVAKMLSLRWPGICSMAQKLPDSEEPEGIVSVDHNSYLSEALGRIVVFADPLSPSTVERLHQWLAICNDSHKECEHKLCYLPTRVLDVQNLETIKLRELPGRKAQYVALSHCWGNCSSFTTTRETLAHMKRGFRIGTAPKTFRDAILVTRILGIRFLWIDSLCIIQQDLTDWTLEGSKMAAVYGNAYLTIIAANSDDDSKGFLTSRSFAYRTLKLSSPVQRSERVYISSNRPISSETEPIAARGWTLQEHYLSLRSLYFGTDQITWTCRHGELYEERSDSIRRGVYKLRPQMMKINSNQNSSWEELVQTFSERNLTFDKDKFPAMAGIASQIAESKGGKYCAGLWWNDMPACLLFWWPYTPRSPLEYIAPSWSWAASNGPIMYRYRDDRQHETAHGIEQAKFLDYFCQTPAQSPYGKIQAPAWLKLYAPLALIRPRTDYIERRSREKEHFMNYLSSVQIKDGRTLQDIVLPPVKNENEWTYILPGSHPDVDCFFDRHWESAQEIYALILARVNRHDFSLTDEEKKMPQNWVQLTGILVRQIVPLGRQDGERIQSADSLVLGQILENAALDSYERIGFFEIKNLERGEAIEILRDFPSREIVLY